MLPTSLEIDPVHGTCNCILPKTKKRKRRNSFSISLHFFDIYISVTVVIFIHRYLIRTRPWIVSLFHFMFSYYRVVLVHCVAFVFVSCLCLNNLYCVSVRFLIQCIMYSNLILISLSCWHDNNSICKILPPLPNYN